MTKPVVLCILDGWGQRAERESNAVALARTPAFDALMAECPNATLTAHGPAVGLPEGQMGNSEVGHTNIGAGRTVWMDLPRIDKAIEEGGFDANTALQGFIEKLKASGGTAHLMGLASPGGVHAHQRHIAKAAQVVAAAGVPVLVHAITDGRDVAPKSARDQLAALWADLPNGAVIGTVIGRFYAMDRDNRWDRVEAAFRALVSGTGVAAESADAATAAAYAAGDTDEFVPPSVIGNYKGTQDGDGLMFLNFRADRAREILSALAAPGFDSFDSDDRPEWAAVCGLVEYSDKHNAFMDVMFPSVPIKNTLGEWVAAHGLRQFRIAETEKYPHVTFFLNGGREQPEAGEVRYVAPSPKVKTYDLQPQMSAREVTEHLIEAVSDDYDLIVVNFANPDMVGHTGDLEAAIAACEAVDVGVSWLVNAVRTVGGAMILTADHGNCETMIDPETGGPHTAHTLNRVPVVMLGGPERTRLRDGGTLGDLAPTLLQLMDLEQPPEMTGRSLIVES